MSKRGQLEINVSHLLTLPQDHVNPPRCGKLQIIMHEPITQPYTHTKAAPPRSYVVQVIAFQEGSKWIVQQEAAGNIYQSFPRSVVDILGEIYLQLCILITQKRSLEVRRLQIN